jgi:hypothetical protein
MSWTIIIKPIVEAILGFFGKKKKEADVTKADALEKTMDSVEESLEKESEIREKQKDVAKEENKSEVTDEDGGLNFDSFNKSE